MSSTQDTPQVQMHQDTRRRGQGYGSLIAPAIVAIVVIILILQNTSEDWRLSFLFWSFSLPGALMLILVLAIGFLIGLLVGAVLRRRRVNARRRAGF